MLFLLSGEGPTDLGRMNLGVKGREFIPGPLTYFINGLFQEKYNYSLLESGTDQIRFITEAELSDFAKQQKSDRQRALLLPGLKNHQLKPHGFMARALGWRADSLKQEESVECVIPVFFRDTDSPDDTDYQEKLNSIDNGFAVSGFPNRGVAMLAKPKSESWLLCLVDSYQNGQKYEEGPGNDDSPKSLKKQLRCKINPNSNNDDLSARELVEFIKSFESIDFEKLACELVSFAEFMKRFNRALNADID
ncbi:hypothetical protein [Neisseria arctica]|uniref:hypothetical protein n=1 Tax=Neisseria arctica TaxID=1470200 RepID=UPI000649841C|nr:hypothetical protein [Neisseria arctica]UOO85695.1 hypothetical protein LVJ86_05495 [Neisseria arctica]